MSAPGDAAKLGTALFVLGMELTMKELITIFYLDTHIRQLAKVFVKKIDKIYVSVNYEFYVKKLTIGWTLVEDSIIDRIFI